VTNPIRPLTTEELELMREVLKHHAPMDDDLKIAITKNALTADQRTLLCHLITLELVGTGLREDDEPNERGLRLEALLDEVNRPNLKPLGVP
jgi:hypothetical protein